VQARVAGACGRAAGAGRWIALAVLLLSGCDQGEPKLEPAPGPPLHAIAIYPPVNAGLDCRPSAGDASAEDGGAGDCGVPLNAPIEIRFDRYLMPSTAVRQAIRVYAGTPPNSVFYEPQYDVIERVVKFVPVGNLVPDLLYTFEFVTRAEGGTNGFLAFDGADLEESDAVPLRFNFRSGTRTETLDNPPVPTCKDVLERVLPSFTCGRAACHNPATGDGCPEGSAREPTDPNGPCVGVPRMGLDLSSPTGLVTTAIGVVAHQTEIGSQGGVALRNPSRFGVQMPRIDPGSPGNSYLMYKLLRTPQHFERANNPDVCTTDHRVPLPDGECLPPSAAESARLRDWFLRGQPMPLKQDLPFTKDQLLDLQRWIAAGARCP
jgi:hypothetical protein